MGKIKQGILGAVSGKVGGVVGSSWKGIAVIKSRPASVANPKTAGQVAQRTKMQNAVAFASPINSDVIKPLWDRFTTQMSGYNAFIKANISLFVAGSPAPAANLVISTGKMVATPISSCDYDGPGKNVAVQWVDDSGSGYKLASDECYIVMHNATKNDTVVSAADWNRDDEHAIVNFVQDYEAGDVVNVYMSFRRADGTIVSNTSYSTFTC